MVAKVALVVAFLYGALLGGFWAVMHRPVLFGQVMKHVPDPAFMVIPFKRLWFAARGGRLKIGDPAPDFSLRSSDRKSRVRLSSFRRHEPVVLVFGSYT
jgi:hypothetical protein